MREVIYLVAMPALLALGAVCVALIQRLGIVNPDSTSPEQRRENAALLPFVFILSSISGAAIGMLFYYSIVNVYPERILPQALLPSRSRGTELTVRDFLKPKELEPKGLGLYSYLLYGSPGNSDYDSKIAAMRAYLSDFSTYKETGLIPNRETLNGFFVFTLEDLEWIDQCDREGFVHSKPNDTNSPKIPTWCCTRDAKKGHPSSIYTSWRKL